MGLTLQLAGLITGARPDDFNDTVLATAQLGFMDAIATALAGVHEDAARTALAFSRRRGIAESGACALPWLSHPLPVSMAALAFGTTAHALDFDDVALSGHPSTVLVPAILCDGMARGQAGRACLEAYVIGYQVWAELAQREPDSLHTKGWHPTAFYGTLAATAALAYAHGMNTNDTATALAIAASLASGLVSNFGTMTKPLHAGRAASLAFEAIEYAQLGLTASHDALEHRCGFLNAISPAGRADPDTAMSKNKKWAISEHGLCIKQYPVCYGAHRAIDAAIDLASAHDLSLRDVKDVRVGLGKPQLAMLRNQRPKTGLEAKFSIQFAMAAALDRRSVNLGQLTDEYVNLPHIQAFHERVESWRVDEPCPDDPAFSLYDRVELTLHDGRVLDSGEVRHPRGHAAKPVDTETLRAKFNDCLRHFAAQDGGNHAALPESDLLFTRVTSMAASQDISLLFAK